MEQGDVYWAQVAPIWKTVSVHSSPEVFLRQFAAVTPVQQNLYAAHWCCSEVSNGGFHQFFTNPTGILAPEASSGFRALGLHECAAIIDEAMGFFGLPYPREQAERDNALSNILGETRQEWDPFYIQDKKFSALMRVENGGFMKAADMYAAQFVS